MILISLVLIFSLIYLIILVSIYYLWGKDTIASGKKSNFNANATIIIAARNEEDNIAACVNSVLENEYYYGSFEIIVIDDHSVDHTQKKVQQIRSENIRLIELPDHLQGKKSAITYGVSHATHSIILTTDADCKVGKNWINTHAVNYENKQINFCTSIVLPEDKNSVLGYFQFFDLISTMATTAAGIVSEQFFLANGANMSFRKEVFEAIGGYEDNISVSSGDDIFLVNKIAKTHPQSVKFISDKKAAVTTKSEKSWKSLINQRIRWASKSSKTNNLSLMLIQGFVFLYALILILGLIIGLSFCSKMIILSILLGIFLKFIIDLVFLHQLTSFYERHFSFKMYFASFFIYFIHIIGSGMVALFPVKYSWKGRDIR